jgi:hypothetical protein
VSQETGFSFLPQGSDAFPQVVGGITNGLSGGFSPIKIGILLRLGLQKYSYPHKLDAEPEPTFYVENLYPNPVTNLKLYKFSFFLDLKNRNVNNENCNIEK